jgi:hypothetical protein
MTKPDAAEVLRLTVASLKGLRPLAVQLSPKARDSVAPVLLCCAAHWTGGADENLRVALDTIECFMRYDRLAKTGGVVALRLVGEADHAR